MKERSKNKINLHEKSTYEKSLMRDELWNFVEKTQGVQVEPFNNIILNWKPYRRIVGYSIRYANEDMKSSELKEAYGILIGLIKDETIVIKDAIPMVSGDRAGVAYENKQYVNMDQIDASIYEKAIKDKENEFIIGWWHTHPGFGFFFSPIDTITQLGYQVPNPHAIGLIFDFSKKKNNSLGIAALRLKNPNRGMRSTYEDISINYKPKRNVMLKKISKIIIQIKKNIKTIEENIKYIQINIYNKTIIQLQEKYCLISEKDAKYLLVNDSDEIEQNLYVWDEEEENDEDKLPEFRLGIENEIKNQKENLEKLKEEKNTAKYEKTRIKMIKKMKIKLENPNKIFNTIKENYNKKKENLLSYYDYFDTNERTLLERIDIFILKYGKILDELNLRIEFNS
ncbi:MAG: Mov34/MPN/PAD-1 family protein [Candidatus Lokiarchaeota archaeon]|nr:Mov34/MPN/PAD-1 family protein [Candidatus Lokiarchaeota archaeon]